MKIVITHTDFRIYWSARILSLQRLLSIKGMELHVIEISGTGGSYSFANKEDKGVQNWHILFPKSNIESIKSSIIKKTLLNKLNLINPDVVIAGAIAFPSGAISTSWAKQQGKKIIIFDDAKIEDVPRNWFVNFIKKRIYGCIDAMIYPSIDWQNTGFYWGFSNEQLFYGVDVVDNHFWQQPISPPNLRYNRYFLTIGRQIPKKNFITIIKAYKEYREKFLYGSYELLLVGDGTEKASIEEYIKYHNIEGITILPFIQQAGLLPLYRNAEAFVIASKQDETWGLVINEAMASGLPVIASNKCGATNTLIKDGINGYIFSPFDISELVEKLCLFHSLSESKKKEMRKNSLAIISEWGLDKFSSESYKAINYVLQREHTRISFIDSIILKLWKGRYRPI